MSTPGSVHHMNDRLLAATFYNEGISALIRQREHEDTKRAIGSILLDDWETNNVMTTRALHAATGFACSPSTEQVLKGRPHNRDVAQEVATNMSDLATHILQTAELYETGIKHRADRRVITELVAEISVLGVLWQGMAHGYRDEKHYALLGTFDQDNAGVVDGYYRGVDIIMRKSGEPKKKGFIQVKNSPGYSPLNPVSKLYHPGIAVMTPALLLEDSQAIGYDLLEVVASDDQTIIQQANRNADAILARAVAKKQHLHRPKSRLELQAA